MKKYKLIILSALLLTAFASVLQAQQSSPKAAMISFNKFDRSHSQTFTRQNIESRKRWFSAELYKLFLNELKREAVYIKTNPTDKPHFGDGLPFQPLDEPCTLNGKSYKRQLTYGQITIKGDAGNVDVHYKYPKGCNLPDILYAFNMEKEKRGWVISDIRYFPGDKSLVEDLNRTMY